MKLSSILSMFMLLTVCSTNILGNNNENDEFEEFLNKQPLGAGGSKSDLKRLWDTGKCNRCNLTNYILDTALERHKGKVSLRDANCMYTNMRGVVGLFKANLVRGNFQGANLEGSDLTDACAIGANFSYANMKKTIMPNATFRRAIFHKTVLEGANFEAVDAINAYMDYADLTNTNIKNALFNDAYLKKTNFKGAEVDEKTSFARADCISTNFRNILNLDKANFSNAILYRCKMNAPLSDKIREQAKIIIGTIFKSYKAKPMHESLTIMPWPTEK